MTAIIIAVVSVGGLVLIAIIICVIIIVVCRCCRYILRAAVGISLSQYTCRRAGLGFE